jgi:hypothetical protein
MTVQERIDSGWIIDAYRKGWREGTVDEFITDFPIFKTPFEQICGLFNGDRNSRVAILKSTAESKWYNLILFTEKHLYHITAKNNWICGGYSNRYYEPLEDWTRGRDLGDGDCTEKTLNKILFRIIGCELLKYNDGSEAPKKIQEVESEPIVVECDEDTSNHKHNVGGTVLTLGLDLDSEHTITLQEVDNIPCVCVHRHHEDGGLHWSKMNDETFELGIPVENIIKYCSERPHMLTEETRKYLKKIL